MVLPSKSEINRCGDLLRDFTEDPGREFDIDDPFEALNHARDVLGEFRSSFSYPLGKVNMGLRAMVRAETGVAQPVVAQRLKRMGRIMEKLVRMPGTNVARLEDIGGCRAVLTSPAAVAGVRRRIERRWDVVRTRDYVLTPKSSGYRAVHLIVRREDRRIEIQLRTKGQQQWADAVERMASGFSLPLKDERGPDEVLDFFRVAGEGIYAEEYGVGVSAELMARFSAANAAMQEWGARLRAGGEG